MKPRARGRAVFLDRDGVIVEEVNYLSSPGQLRLIPGSAGAIARLRKAGFRAVVVSNQSAVARGLLSLKGLGEIHRALVRLLRRRGARLDAIYFCPHHPRAGGRKGCGCRKPKTGMIEAAARRFRLDLSRCYLVGDSTTDIRTALNAGCRPVLVRTGKAGKDGLYRAKPEKVCRDLSRAADWILARAHRGPPSGRFCYTPSR